MRNESVECNEDIGNVQKIKTCSIISLIISLLSVVTDVLIGTFLILCYYFQGKISWAVITFCFMFFPSIIIQILSIKIYLISRKIMPREWVLHLLLLGFIYRYLCAIKKSMTNYKTKESGVSKLEQADVIILNNLYLIKSFMECAPQLVFQLYVLLFAQDQFLLTSILAFTSAFSVSWALVVHTKMRKGIYSGLIFLIIWRAGGITARISALMLCACICGPWMILFMGSHWLAMTLWITYQKAAVGDKLKKGDFHSAFYGVIYCFCFFSLKAGPSRWSSIILNLLLLFENLMFLTVFLMTFSGKSPTLAVAAFITVTVGSLIGMSSFFIYITFFHPTEPKHKCVLNGMVCCGSSNCMFGKKSYFHSLLPKRVTPERKEFTQENKELQEMQSSSDSVIIIEENPTPNADLYENIAQNLTEETENIYDEPKSDEAEVKLSAALKRRAICSSVDLRKFADDKAEVLKPETSRSCKAVTTDETPSEILSAHDYENLCAVNIAREPWGIRSWRCYSDIETWRHDDSVFNERRLDVLTSSSEYSGKVEDKDSLNIAEDDLLNCETDTNSDKTSVNFVPPLPASMLHTIFEEREASPSSHADIEDGKIKCNSESTLVATIDRICLYTPLRCRSGSIDNHAELNRFHAPSANEDGGCEKVEKHLKGEIRVDVEKKESASPLKEKIRCVQKFNIFRERYEINRYQVHGKIPSASTEGSEALKRVEENKENILTETRRQTCGARTECVKVKKRFSFKDKSSALIHMLTPSKFEKRTFPISPMKR